MNIVGRTSCKGANVKGSYDAESHEGGIDIMRPCGTEKTWGNYECQWGIELTLRQEQTKDLRDGHGV